MKAGKSQIAPSTRQQIRGQVNYLSGLAAEQAVARAYVNAGHRLENRRWRAKAGEIDLIFRTQTGVIFVEVKASKSHDAAAQLLGFRQQKRLLAAAGEYLASADPEGLWDARMDVALVDQRGQVKILENAIGH